MFLELQRVLKPDGSLCVMTQSHEQIQNRFYNCYFPTVATNEKRRYPDIKVLVEFAVKSGLDHDDTEVLPAASHATITHSFIKNVEERNYSMFRLLDEHEFKNGLKRIRGDLGKTVKLTNAGETLVWFRR